MFLITKETITLIILAICVLPILILMVIAIIIAIRRSQKKSIEMEAAIKATDDNSQRQLFLQAFGGEENIEDVIIQMSRVSITVKDLELVQVEDLKELGASGVLLVGNVVKCSFGDRAPYIFKLLSKEER
ncbi:MAG: PTS transporter subunit EIIB [Bacilli bacterium]|nr:PTS transporter subunit EIIB [Bacilli bacterium]